jgi:hypothetical protein
LGAFSNTSTDLDNYEDGMKFLNPTQDRQFDGLFGRVFKIPKVTFSFVYLSVRTEKSGSHWTGLNEIWYLRIFRKSLNQIQVSLKYRGADKSLGRPGRKEATATEEFEFHICYL